MTDDPELDWLIELRPLPEPPTQGETARARAALIAHGGRRRRVRRRAQGAIAVALLAGAGATLLVAEDPAARPAPGGARHAIASTPTQTAPVAAPTPSGAAPGTTEPTLVSLALDVRRIRKPPGDATLVSYHYVRTGRHALRFWEVNLFSDRGPRLLRQLAARPESRDLRAPDPSPRHLARRTRRDRPHGRPLSCRGPPRRAGNDRRRSQVDARRAAGPRQAPPDIPARPAPISPLHPTDAAPGGRQLRLAAVRGGARTGCRAPPGARCRTGGAEHDPGRAPGADHGRRTARAPGPVGAPAAISSASGCTQEPASQFARSTAAISTC